MNTRQVCTPEHPYTRDSEDYWIHPEAKDTGYNNPYWDYYYCPVCGLTFKVEVAE